MAVPGVGVGQPADEGLAERLHAVGGLGVREQAQRRNRIGQPLGDTVGGGGVRHCFSSSSMAVSWAWRFPPGAVPVPAPVPVVSPEPPTGRG